MRQEYSPSDHMFVICAYQESPYLGACIRSLLSQSVRTGICIATSTPNDMIRRQAEHYHLPLFVNHGEKGIAGDWNFALSCAGTRLVTIAHQDDLYGKQYAERILRAANECRHPLLVFSDYCELREVQSGTGERPSWQIVPSDRLLRVKRLLLLPLVLRPLWKSRPVRRFILSLGSAICCPAVTLACDHLEMPVFENNMKSNIDWQAWEKISKKRGEFAYIPEPLMLHRIHGASTTSGLLAQNGRMREDLVMYRKFWPEPAARAIEHFYRTAEKSNGQPGR